MHVARSVVSVGLGALLACGPDAEGPTSIRLTPSPNATALDGRASFEWSEPVWLGPVVNSPDRDLNPELSPDGLSLYFTSFRDGPGKIYVAQRAREGCPWGAPVRLGPPINVDDGLQFSPDLSPDGHFLYFASTGHGGFGDGDLFISHRVDRNDDFGWGPPVNLGPAVNTAGFEQGPQFGQAGGGELYFGRQGAPARIFVVPMNQDGRFRGDAVAVEELDHPMAVNNGEAALRQDGRELMFWSRRPGAVGLADIFVSTRRDVWSPWSEPRSLAGPVNHEGSDLALALSLDGNTMVFSTDRPGGLGRPDLWMTVRSPNGSAVAEVGDGRNCPGQ